MSKIKGSQEVAILQNKLKPSNEIYVTRQLLDQLCAQNSVADLSEKATVRSLQKVGNYLYAIHGTGSTGGVGCLWAWGHKVTLLELLNGNIPPKENVGYSGTQFKYQGKKHIMIGELITFYPIPEEKQLELF